MRIKDKFSKAHWVQILIEVETGSNTSRSTKDRKAFMIHSANFAKKVRVGEEICGPFFWNDGLDTKARGPLDKKRMSAKRELQTVRCAKKCHHIYILIRKDIYRSS